MRGKGGEKEEATWARHKKESAWQKGGEAERKLQKRRERNNQHKEGGLKVSRGKKEKGKKRREKIYCRQENEQIEEAED